MRNNRTKLSEVADVVLSNVDKKKREGEQKVHLLNFTDVYNNWSISKKNIAGFMEATASISQIEKLSLKRDQVALTKDSETRNDIGIPCYVADSCASVVLGYHCALITPRTKLLDGSFLNAYLNSRMAQEYFSNNATGSGMRYSLSLDAIKDLPLELPPFEDQEKIGRFFSLIDRKICRNKEINRNLSFVS